MGNDLNEALAHPSSRDFRVDRRRFMLASAAGIAVGMHAPSRAASQNPVINQNGGASINSGQYCTWKTANGKRSTISIANASRANMLKIAISGAPSSGIVIQVNGAVVSSLNNMFTLQPNSPYSTIEASGDFKGASVTITNITNSQMDATAAINCGSQ